MLHMVCTLLFHFGCEKSSFILIWHFYIKSTDDENGKSRTKDFGGYTEKEKKATEVHLKLFFFQIFWWRVDRESESIKVDIKRILSIGSIDNLERNRLVVFLTSNFKKKRDTYRIWEREREMYPFKEPNDSSTTHSRSSSLLFSFFQLILYSSSSKTRETSIDCAWNRALSPPPV
jgi:hypothetical protein